MGLCDRSVMFYPAEATGDMVMNFNRLIVMVLSMFGMRALRQMGRRSGPQGAGRPGGGQGAGKGGAGAQGRGQQDAVRAARRAARIARRINR